MRLAAVVACDRNLGIADSGARFRKSVEPNRPWGGAVDSPFNVSSEAPVVLGPRTFRELAFSDLLGRKIIVLSSQSSADLGIPPSVARAFDLHDAVSVASAYGDKVFFLGGSDVFRSAVPHCHEVWIAWTRRAYSCNDYLDLGRMVDLRRSAEERPFRKALDFRFTPQAFFPDKSEHGWELWRGENLARRPLPPKKLS